MLPKPTYPGYETDVAVAQACGFTVTTHVSGACWCRNIVKDHPYALCRFNVSRNVKFMVDLLERFAVRWTLELMPLNSQETRYWARAAFAADELLPWCEGYGETVALALCGIFLDRARRMSELTSAEREV